MSLITFDYNPPLHPYVSVVHLDDDLLVLSKPPGLLAVPGKDPGREDSLETRAKAAFPRALLTHRIDMATSGIMLMAMNKRAQSQIGKHFERRLIDKTYVAVVWGHVEGESGEIDLPICVDWLHRPMQKICHENGKPSQTLWRVLSRDVTADGVKTTRVELKPLTGRSHQLRVHMLSMGHPILGDPFYAYGPAFTAASRLMLHAQSITLHHPGNGERVTYEDVGEF